MTDSCLKQVQGHDTTEYPSRLTAVISGLKLEGEIKELQTSMQYREKVRAPLKGNVLIEASVIGNMQETLLSLLEGRYVIEKMD